MNILAVLSLIIACTGYMFLAMDHHYYSYATVQALEKNVRNTYLLEGLLAHGQELYLNKRAPLAGKHIVMYHQAPKDAHCALTFEQQSDDIMKITADIQDSQTLSRELIGYCQCIQ